MRGRITLAAASLAATAVLGCAGAAAAHAGAEGVAAHSPGILSGNVIQVPVHVPVNACGNTISIIGALNPTLGNFCGNV
ncbi:chaplin [Streptomyces sp. AK02-04a]|uniref:chaplin n=1 Tax=Streptomyces sp. AK02-04a TaxID=3028649 RepID=UPI0029A2DF47|nr:chaplin [Streptomyces sp. AK02-04a]MDX3763876.1 chaplin [Streptomyces sp. AK02-04a]